MTKPTTKKARLTQAERTALSDQRMFAAAISLINERGTQKTTLKEIGELAGYSRGLANYRFGSKDGLLAELFIYFDGLWKAHLGEYIGDLQGLAALKAAGNALRDFLNLEADYMRAMYLLWYESLGHESETRARLGDHHRVYRKDVQRWISEGIAAGEIRESVNAEQFAVQYCAFVFGLVYQWLVSPEVLDLSAVFADYQENQERILSV
ncbi:MAG: TetR/AcrR family transcriptional regulator [Pseudomonadales bacterium]